MRVTKTKGLEQRAAYRIVTLQSRQDSDPTVNSRKQLARSVTNGFLWSLEDSNLQTRDLRCRFRSGCGETERPVQSVEEMPFRRAVCTPYRAAHELLSVDGRAPHEIREAE